MKNFSLSFRAYYERKREWESWVADDCGSMKLPVLLIKFLNFWTCLLFDYDLTSYVTWLFCEEGISSFYVTACHTHLVPGPGPVQGEVADQGVLWLARGGGLVPGGDHHPAPLRVLIQHLAPGIVMGCENYHECSWFYLIKSTALGLVFTSHYYPCLAPPRLVVSLYQGSHYDDILTTASSFSPGISTGG